MASAHRGGYIFQAAWFGRGHLRIVGSASGVRAVPPNEILTGVPCKTEWNFPIARK